MHPELQRDAAKRIGATTIARQELSHVTIPHLEIVFDEILTFTNSFEGAVRHGGHAGHSIEQEDR